MATTSLLYHAFGLKDYTLLSTKYKNGGTFFHITMKHFKRRCAICDSRRITKAGKFTRTFKEVPIGHRPTYLVLHGHRQNCSECGVLCQEPILFSTPRKRYSRGFARLVIDLTKHMALLHVAQFLGIGWDLVKEIYSTHLNKKLKRRKLSKVRYIAVDEFSVKKGHKYITLLMDLETGCVLFAAPGKDAESLIPFLFKLKRVGAQLKAAAIDMSRAYQKAIKTVFPHLDIVHDPYHVVAMVNKALDQVRKDIYNRLSSEGKKVIKGSRYLLLHALEKLKPDQIEYLTILLESNQPLYIAYLLKEDLRRFWDFQDKHSAALFLVNWLDQAVDSDLKPFVKLALSLMRHFDGLFAYFKHRISTGPLEGLNNKVKTLKRMAYGYRDMNFFILRLLFIHESTYAITG